jgi:hypothetical protein
MYRTVGFNNEFCLVTIEIGNIIKTPTNVVYANWVLPQKLLIE